MLLVVMRKERKRVQQWQGIECGRTVLVVANLQAAYEKGGRARAAEGDLPWRLFLLEDRPARGIRL